MATAADLSALADVSRQLGADPSCVQGGGGNTSLKTSDGMWVKASGFSLAEVTAEQGFVLVNDASVRQQIEKCRRDAEYTALISSCLISGKGRPSMETGFHALLGQAVLHSHAVLTNLLCCANEGEDIARKILPEAQWVPYTTPGLPLTLSLAAVLKGKAMPSVILLQNHGLIVSGDTPHAAWSIHQKCTRHIADYFKIEAADLSSAKTIEADASCALFPDQVVYLQNEQLRKTKAGQETLHAYAVLRTLLPKIGLTPRYLRSQDVDVLLGMEAEKYRQNIVTA